MLRGQYWESETWMNTVPAVSLMPNDCLKNDNLYHLFKLEMKSI